MCTVYSSTAVRQYVWGDQGQEYTQIDLDGRFPKMHNRDPKHGSECVTKFAVDACPRVLTARETSLAACPRRENVVLVCLVRGATAGELSSWEQSSTSGTGPRFLDRTTVGAARPVAVNMHHLVMGASICSRRQSSCRRWKPMPPLRHDGS